MGLKNTLRTWFLDWLGESPEKSREAKLEKLHEYYEGEHKPQLRVKPGKFDDNLTINLCGLIVDKSVSALVGDPASGHGLTWTFPSETDGEKPKSIQWLDAQWEAVGREIWLHKNALIGATSGFPVVKLVPDGKGNIRPINIKPEIVEVVTDPQDADKVLMYVLAYSLVEDNKNVEYREETKPVTDTSWVVELKKNAGGDRWEIVSSTPWPYPFAPILCWQNLPDTEQPYGRSDIESIIPIQDRYNFLVSNISKIIRLYAHPNRYGRNLTAQMEDGQFKMGPDEMPIFNGDGEIVQMPAVGDLPGAMQFLQTLRESAFVLSREVDTLSMKDRVGQITNFALRVLYRDFLDKLGTKRMLYGAAYQELNRRMLALGNYEPETCIIDWPDPLPVNEVEEISALKADRELGLVSKQTAQKIRGYDPEDEDERMAAEAQTETDAGANILKSFFRTGQ